MATSIWGSNGGVAATPAATNRIPTDISSGGAPNHHTLQQLADLGASIGVTTQALGSINTNTTITWSSGSYVTATITGSLTFTFAGAPSSGQGFQGVLVLTNGGSAAITWPGSVTWMGGTAPTLTASGVNVLYFVTSNGGTNWYGWTEYDEQSYDASAITSGTFDAARLPAATTIASGAVELATVAECQAGTDTTRATTPEGVAAAIAALGLAQPLATPRFTGQTSVPSAASAGEVKAYVRQLGKAFAAAYRGEVGDHVLLLPSISHPLVRGVWVTNSTTLSSKSGNPNTAAGSNSASTHNAFPSLQAINSATAATAATQAGRSNSTATLSSTQGFLTWSLVSCPDASYGSGATGCKIQIGVTQSNPSATTARLNVRGAVFEYNTNSSDTNWQAVIANSGGTQTPVDTGLAFSAQATYLCVVFIPRSGSSTYFYINDLTNGAEGSATVAHLPESTALFELAIITTFDNVARNIRTGDMFTLVGGAI